MQWMPLVMAAALASPPDFLGESLDSLIEVPQDSSVLYIESDEWQAFDSPAPASSAVAPYASSAEYAYFTVPSVKTAEEAQAEYAAVKAVCAIREAARTSAEALHAETIKAFAAVDAPTRCAYINAAIDAAPIGLEARAAHAIAEAAIESQTAAVDLAHAVMLQPDGRVQKIAMAVFETMSSQQVQECIAAVAADDDFAKADAVIVMAYASSLRNGTSVSSKQSRAVMFKLLARPIPLGHLAEQSSSEWYDRFTASGGSKLWWIISEAKHRTAAGQPIDDLHAAFDRAMAEWLMLDDDQQVPDKE